ncbi:MAG TPA: hypothetical protein VK993_02495 [Chthoniobacterales bacterium]|nr:hypothetical protein [Chthoniobacterales bacterium]
MVLLLVIAGPPALAFYMMCTHWVAVPFWDEWQTPGAQIASHLQGTLTFAELCSQHNESRKLFPRLVYLPVALAAGWDVRYIMVLTFALVCAGSVLLYALARRSCGSPLASLVCFAAMNVWLFWPRQYESFVLSIQGELFVPPLALLGACLINLSRLGPWHKAGANAALAHFSTYTVANGMLVWLLAVPLVTRTTSPGARSESANRTARLARCGYAGAGVTSISCYFYGYHTRL